MSLCIGYSCGHFLRSSDTLVCPSHQHEPQALSLDRRVSGDVAGDAVSCCHGFLLANSPHCTTTNTAAHEIIRGNNEAHTQTESHLLSAGFVVGFRWRAGGCAVDRAVHEAHSFEMVHIRPGMR